MNDFLANFAAHPWLTLALVALLSVGYAIANYHGYNEGLREGLSYRIQIAIDEETKEDE